MYAEPSAAVPDPLPPDDDLPVRAERRARRRLRALWRSLWQLALALRTAALVAAAALLIVVSKVDIQLLRTVQMMATDAAVAVLAAAKMPLAAVRTAAREVGALLAARSENARLRAEVERLREWRSRAIRLEVENRALRRLLAMPLLETRPRRTVARVVGDGANPFARLLVLDAGRNRGLARGMAVVNAEGLVGRIVAVGERSARVMPLTDRDSRIPVLVGSSGDPGVLEGDNTPNPKLRFLPLNPRVRLGDEVLTSGRGGLLPPGLPVGRVRAVRDRQVVVEPYVDWTRLDYVAVLDYPGVTPPAADRSRATAPGHPQPGPHP